jgi:glutathione S-transferase
MKLISADTSPYARKVRIVMFEKKIECQYETVDVWSPDTPINALNPLGKVPTLIMEDGGAVFDSRVIVEYLDSLTPLHRLIPQSGRERLEVKCWEALSDGLLDAALLVRLESTQRPEALRSATWVERQMKKINLSLEAMSKGLGEKTWCSGNSYSLSDIAVGCALGYLDFRFPQLDWRNAHINLATHYAKLAKRPSFLSTDPSPK